MTPRSLKIALGVSVALNLFAIGALATGGVRLLREDDRPPRAPSMREVVRSLPEAERERVTDALRTTALAARPDFQTARAARRQAVALAGQPEFDRSAIAELLRTSSDAEMLGRARLEAGALDVLEDMTAADRARFAPILAKTGPRTRRKHRDAERGGEERSAAKGPETAPRAASPKP